MIVVSILHVFVLSVLFVCHRFQLITLVHILMSSYGRQTAAVRGSIREAFVLDEGCKTFKVAAFSPLVLKSNIFEKTKYAQEKEILRNFQYKKRMLVRFVDFEISNYN